MTERKDHRRNARKAGAAPPAHPETRAESQSYLVFSLPDSTLALDIDHVLCVERILPITPVPGAPPYVTGVVNLQGNITAVVDLGRLRGHRAMSPEQPTCILMALLDGHPCGLLAIQTHEVHDLLANEIVPPLPDLTGLHLVQGLAEVEGVTVGILDADRLATLLTDRFALPEIGLS